MRYFAPVILGFAAIAAGFAGCTSAKEYLRANASSFEITADDTSAHAVVVEASSSWIVDTSVVAEWLTVWYDATDPNPDPNLLWVKAAVNEERDERAAEITLVSGDGLLLVIPIVQLGMVARFGVTPSELEPFAARDDNKQIITVDTPLSWEALQLGGNWIELIKGTEEEGTANILYVGVKPTRLFEQRSDTIVLRPGRVDYRDFADSIVVVQAAIDLVVAGETMNEETGEITVPTEGGEVPLSVFSRYAWTLSTDASPGAVSIDLTEHEGDSIENGTPIEITVTPNTSTEEDHLFTLTFESGGEIYEYRCRQPKSNPPEPEPEEEI